MDGFVVVHSLLAVTVVATVAAVWVLWRLTKSEQPGDRRAMLVMVMSLSLFSVATLLPSFCFLLVIINPLLILPVGGTVAGGCVLWRLSKPEGRRALPAVLTVTVGLCVWYVAVFLVLLCFMDNDISRRQLLVRSFLWGHRQFDSEVWKASSRLDTSLTIEEEDRRGEMLFGLLRTHRLLGMERDEVLELLGKPDWGGEPGGYMIGVHTGIDPDVFHVFYDTQGTVRDYKVKQY